MRSSYPKVLYIDDREPAYFCELVAENCTIPVEFKRLKTGDYVCEDVAIERKAINDFAASVISPKKRMWKQADRLRKEFRFPYIVISGTTKEITSAVTDHALMGAIAYLTTPRTKGNVILEPAIPVVKVDTDQQLAYLILKIMEKHHKLELCKDLKHI